MPNLSFEEKQIFLTLRGWTPVKIVSNRVRFIDTPIQWIPPDDYPDYIKNISGDMYGSVTLQEAYDYEDGKPSKYKDWVDLDAC